MTRITSKDLRKKKLENKSISALTCYDATFARILDQQTNLDMVLVGDSLGTVVKGEDNTLNVTLDEIIFHTKAVARGSQRMHLVADMPFLSYQIDKKETLKNAGKLIQAGANAVKIEGGESLTDTVKSLVQIGIPVMGHIGLTPQHINALGGYKVQGKSQSDQERLIADALALQQAGAYAIVIECTPENLAQEITNKLEIPTIGIGAGKYCDGQILVLYDLLDLNPEFRPKFVKQFLNGGALIANACQSYVNEVQEGLFPAPKQSYYPKDVS